jgi:hypothetical protein
MPQSATGCPPESRQQIAILKKEEDFAAAWREDSREANGGKNSAPRGGVGTFLKLFVRLPGVSDDGNSGFPDRQIKPTIDELMKTMIRYPLAIAVLAAGVRLNVLADPPPGQVDFGKFTPSGDGGEFVEIQIKSNLLSLAAQMVEKQEPDVAKIMRSVELIHVNVIGLTDANRADVEKRVRQIRHDLDAQGWEHNVVVQQKDGEDVGVYTKTRGGEALAGLAITVIEPKAEVVLINIVGDIRPDQVPALGEKLDIEPLKKVGAALKDATPKDAAPKK